MRYISFCAIPNLLTDGCQDHVEFVLNAPFSVVLDWLSLASIGLSTMVDEHFGINVVEFMVRSSLIPRTTR